MTFQEVLDLTKKGTPCCRKGTVVFMREGEDILTVKKRSFYNGHFQLKEAAITYKDITATTWMPFDEELVNLETRRGCDRFPETWNIAKRIYTEIQDVYGNAAKVVAEGHPIDNCKDIDSFIHAVYQDIIK